MFMFSFVTLRTVESKKQLKQANKQILVKNFSAFFEKQTLSLFSELEVLWG